MAPRNKYGLSRHIPVDVQREVRRRSRFGCVTCRAGVYQYEHIEPEFAEAQAHDPARIACLCGACHDKVTRGLWSKAKIFADYNRVRHDPKTPLPRDFFDFHAGNVSVRIGGVRYRGSLAAILRAYGQDVVRLIPGDGERPGGISAVFTNDRGVAVFRIHENVWEGNRTAGDIIIAGNRIAVQGEAGRVALQLRHEPPGLIVVEHLDMRWGPVRILATEDAYAIGRPTKDPTVLRWCEVIGTLQACAPNAVAIAVERCWRDTHIHMRSDVGIGLAAHGFRVGVNCAMVVRSISAATAPLTFARDSIFRHRRHVREWLPQKGRI